MRKDTKNPERSDGLMMFKAADVKISLHLANKLTMPSLSLRFYFRFILFFYFLIYHTVSVLIY